MSSLENKPIVIFVDDEPMVLQGLRRLLRGMRNEWVMEFIEGGPAALERLGQGPIDAIISDMRMPTVNGAQVVAEAARRHPESIRVILSGYSEQESLLQALGPAHQYLVKPSTAEEIVGTVRRALRLRKMLPVEKLRALTTSWPSLPVPSETFRKLVKEIDDPLASARSVGDTIETDLGLTAQVLRLANSAYFGLPRKLTHAREAVEMLGLETVRALLTVSQFYLTGWEGAPVPDKALAERSLRIGALARELADSANLDKASVDHAATAGLLAHIGTLVLHVNAQKQCVDVEAALGPGRKRICDAERDVIGVSHAELGAYLSGLWGFADQVVEAIAFHHKPSECMIEVKAVLAAVHAAQALAAGANTESKSLFHDGSRSPDLDVDFVDASGIDISALI